MIPCRQGAPTVACSQGAPTVSKQTRHGAYIIALYQVSRILEHCQACRSYCAMTKRAQDVAHGDGSLFACLCVRSTGHRCPMKTSYLRVGTQGWAGSTPLEGCEAPSHPA